MALPSRLLAVALGASCLLGCEQSGSALVVIDLRTDFVAGFEFSRVRTFVEVGGAGGLERSATFDVTSASDFLVGQRVAEIEDLEPGTVSLRVELHRSDGAIIASRRVRVRAQGRTGVTVVITRSCGDLVCPAADDPADATQCLGGRCVAPECTVESPESCGVASCRIPGDCPEAASCTQPVCLLGACLYGAQPDACGADMYCDPTLGCRRVDGSSPDAGPEIRCGDGVVAGSEGCDDLGLVDGDGCSSDCAVEPGWICAGVPSVCSVPTSCGEILGADPTATDGLYTIAPEGTGGPSYEVYCEMSDGGWTWIVGHESYADGSWPATVGGANLGSTDGWATATQGNDVCDLCRCPQPTVSVTTRVPHTTVYLEGSSRYLNADATASIDIGNDGAREWEWNRYCSCGLEIEHMVERSVATPVSESRIRVNAQSCQYRPGVATIRVLKVR